MVAYSGVIVLCREKTAPLENKGGGVRRNTISGLLPILIKEESGR
jgi:hypothetical protein